MAPHDEIKGLRHGLTAYGDPAFSLFLRKIFIKAMGYGDDALERPIVGITDTFSDFNPCHGNVPDLIAAVKRGVMLEGGLPLVFPTISLGESFTYPTSMFLRNLMAMETEEMLRAQPMDAVVLIGGCDKTVPAQLMAAASADIPAVQLVTGPMLAGTFRGERVGACTDCRRLWGEFRAGRLSEGQIAQASDRLAPTRGTCMVMGTASTMAILAEVLGLALPGSAAIPATHADRLRAAEASGRCAVGIARRQSPRPSEILNRAAFRNAMIVLQAIGGSTNGLIHLTAIAGRLGLPVDLAEFDAIGREVPVLVDLKPTGAHFLEDFHRAGGLPRLLVELQDVLDVSARGVSGLSLAELLTAAETIAGQTIIRSRRDPVKAIGAMAVLRGSLAPGGALIKQAAATPALLDHRGRAVVFESVAALIDGIDDPARAIEAGDVLVLRNAGPKGGPGMPEAGYLPIPKRLLQQGITDMVRISDARMSGTAFGTIVLHVTPEAAEGGPLALVRDGDMIHLDVARRRLDLLVEPAELERRRAAWHKPAPPRGSERGYARLYLDSVLQADQGCDFGFLKKNPEV